MNERTRLIRFATEPCTCIINTVRQRSWVSVTNCFSTISDLQGNIQEIFNRLFLTAHGSFIMQVNLMQCHCWIPWSSLHALTAFDILYSQTWSKNTKKFMTKHFLTFKQFYLIELSGVYSLYLMSFLMIC